MHKDAVKKKNFYCIIILAMLYYTKLNGVIYMGENNNIKYIKNLSNEDFVDFATWWANKHCVETVNSPKLYNEFKRYSLVFHDSLTGFEDEDLRILVFEDYYCANDREPGAMEYTVFWIPYVYSRLPEEFKDSYAKGSELVSQRVFGSAYDLKKVSEILKFPTQSRELKNQQENEPENE